MLFVNLKAILEAMKHPPRETWLLFNYGCSYIRFAFDCKKVCMIMLLQQALKSIASKAIENTFISKTLLRLQQSAHNGPDSVN